MTVESTTSLDNLRAPNWEPGVGPTSAPSPRSFRDLPLSDGLFQALDAVGYETPTPVQAQTIPLSLAGLDLIVQSQTGTGKTAAFAIPTVELLEEGTEQVEALILTPTRELAKQVGGEYERLGQYKNVPVACIYGGTGFQQQFEELKTAQVVCATPGRLLDLLKRKAMTLDHLKLFILDEADEMLNMGFEKELTAIVARLPEARQSLLFSATVSEDIQRLASHILRHPEFVTFSSDQVAAEEVKHVYYMVTGMGRLWDLTRIIEVENPESAIVFCNTREDTFLVTNFLKKQGYAAEVLNGDLPQKEREATLTLLREGKIRFLVATDVAARGIDISDLSHVLNYSLPESPETYIHRTGRTGRAGKRGEAISLIAPREIGTYYILRRVFKMELDERELPTPEDLVLIREERALASVTERVEALAPASEHLGAASKLLERADAAELVARLIGAAMAASDDDVAVSSSALDEAALRAPRGGRPAKAVAPAPQAAAPAPKVEAPAVEEEEAAADAEEVAVEVAAEVAEVVEAQEESKSEEAAEEEEPVMGRRRRRRGRRARASEEGAESESEEAPRRRRRRRRRSEESSDEAVAAKGEGEAAEAPAEAAEAPAKAAEAPVEDTAIDEYLEGAIQEAAEEAAKEVGDEDSGAGRRGRRSRRGRRPRRERQEEVAAAEEAEEAPAPEPEPEARPSRRRRTRPSRNEAARVEPVAEAQEAEGQEEQSLQAALEAINSPKEMVKIKVNAGSSTFENDDDLLEQMCLLSGMERADFGDVRRRVKSSLLEVRHDMVDDIIEAVHGQVVGDWKIKAVLT